MAYSGNTTFRDSMKLGQEGEQLVREHFSSIGFTVVDLTEDEDWQAVDVDFQLIGPDGKQWLADVKTDTECWETGNIILEVRMHRLFSGQVALGWYSESAMDTLLYLCAGSGRLYVIDFDLLRSLVNHGMGRFTRFINPIDPGCIGEGILVSVEELLKSPALISCEQLDTSCLWRYDWRHDKPAPF